MDCLHCSKVSFDSWSGKIRYMFVSMCCAFIQELSTLPIDVRKNHAHKNFKKHTEHTSKVLVYGSTTSQVAGLYKSHHHYLLNDIKEVRTSQLKKKMEKILRVILWNCSIAWYLANEDVGRLSKNQTLFCKTEQDNCFINQQIVNERHFMAGKFVVMHFSKFWMNFINLPYLPVLPTYLPGLF